MSIEYACPHIRCEPYGTCQFTEEASPVPAGRLFRCPWPPGCRYTEYSEGWPECGEHGERMVPVEEDVRSKS